MAPPLALVGPTASGKSELAMALARRHPGIEVVCVDSMVVYRGMDIGTAKPSAADRSEVRHHLLDLVSPWEDFSVDLYRRAAGEALAEVAARGGRPLLVGGTGLYLAALVDGLAIPGRWPQVAAALEDEADALGPEALHERLARLDPAAAARILPRNRRRVVRALEVTIGAGRPFSSFGPGLGAYPPAGVQMIGVRVERDVLDRRIEERVHAQMDAGWLDEVRRLAALRPGLSRTARQALGYRELLAHIEEGLPLEDAVAATIRRTRRLARRQRAWFERDPRIRWHAAGGEALAAAERALAQGRAPGGGAAAPRTRSHPRREAG